MMLYRTEAKVIPAYNLHTTNYVYEIKHVLTYTVNIHVYTYNVLVKELNLMCT